MMSVCFMAFILGGDDIAIFVYDGKAKRHSRDAPDPSHHDNLRHFNQKLSI